MGSRRKLNTLNHIKPATNISFNMILFLISLICIIPLILVLMISISAESSLSVYGYRFIPEQVSFSAYKFLWNERKSIFNSFLLSVIVTVSGTLLGLFLTSTMGYALSRREFRFKKFYTYVIFIPMLFSGGMVANYIVVANVLGLRNNILALILPLLVASYNIIICKTFFRLTVPDSVIDSAKIDGASQFRIYSHIVLPVSKPVLATIGLFSAFGYWNDWFQSSLYINDRKLISLQALLNNIMKNVEYLASNPTAGLSLTQYKNLMPTESVRMAIAIVIVIPIACAYPFLQRYFITGLTLGAIKE
jgi:putative aldouronate transport system permease protein